MTQYDRDLFISAFPRGAIVAVCELVAVCVIMRRAADQHTAFDRDGKLIAVDEPERSFGDYTPGRYAWVLTNIRALKDPIPCKGALSLWDVSGDIDRLIGEQLR